MKRSWSTKRRRPTKNFSKWGDVMAYYSDCWTYPKEEIEKLINEAKQDVEGKTDAIAGKFNSSGYLKVGSGGTGAGTASGARANLGIGSLAVYGSETIAEGEAADLIQIKTGDKPVYPVCAETGAGYMKFADGTMLQYGEVENAESNGVNKIFFPQPFKDVNYFITTGSAFNITHQFADFRLIPQSAAVDYFFLNFKPYNGTGNYSSAALAYWIAVGKWK